MHGKVFEMESSHTTSLNTSREDKARMFVSTFLESLREYFSQLGFEIKLLRQSCFCALKPESLACRSCTGDRPSPNDPPITLVVIKFSGNVSKFSASLSMPFAAFKADVKKKRKEKQKKYILLPDT